MSGAYPVPAARRRVELIERRSRFVATVDRSASVADARSLIEEMRAEMPGASHHPYAFCVGFGASVTCGAGDDGEPPGTAGRPALAVLRGSGLGDVCLVISRTFGGTKLGAGGLVRAYTAAAQLALAQVPRTLKQDLRRARLTVPHALYPVVGRLVAAYQGEVAEAAFGAEVTLHLRLPSDRLDGLSAALAELTAGRAELRTETAADA